MRRGMDSYWFWLFIAITVVLVSWGLWWLVGWANRIHENHFLTPKERWQRRYDRNLKKHFKEF